MNLYSDLSEHYKELIKQNEFFTTLTNVLDTIGDKTKVLNDKYDLGVGTLQGGAQASHAKVDKCEKNVQKVNDGRVCNHFTSKSFSTCPWPELYGCTRDPTNKIIGRGSYFDRFGHIYGFYAGEVKGRASNFVTHSYIQRSMLNLPRHCPSVKDLDYTSLQYSIYETRKNIEVLYCSAAPWADKPGGAIQYLFPAEKHLLVIKQILNELPNSSDIKQIYKSIIKKITELVPSKTLSMEQKHMVLKDMVLLLVYQVMIKDFLQSFLIFLIY
jgi:hypothetical protein